MGIIKILRWRIGGAMGKLAKGPGNRSRETGSPERAAVFLAALGEEYAELLFAELTLEETRRLRAEMGGLSESSLADSLDVILEFSSGLSTRHIPTYVSRDDPEELARAFVRANPSSTVDRLRALWLWDEEELLEAVEEEEGDLELEFEDLQPSQKAAVFMMWLPAALSAEVLGRFNADFCRRVTETVIELPYVTPKARELVLGEFMEGVTLGIPGLSVDDVGLPVLVEAFVRSDPGAVARRLEVKWLAESPPDLEGPSEVSRMEKAAIFLQSLSLPLAYRLLREMEEEEAVLLLATLDRLGPAEAAVRKVVLQELMRASRFGEGESQPIHVLGEAMGRMIRRRPDVVVNRMRRLWLSDGT